VDTFHARKWTLRHPRVPRLRHPATQRGPHRAPQLGPHPGGIGSPSHPPAEPPALPKPPGRTGGSLCAYVAPAQPARTTHAPRECPARSVGLGSWCPSTLQSLPAAGVQCPRRSDQVKRPSLPPPIGASWVRQLTTEKKILRICKLLPPPICSASAIAPGATIAPWREYGTSGKRGSSERSRPTSGSRSSAWRGAQKVRRLPSRNLLLTTGTTATSASLACLGGQLRPPGPHRPPSRNQTRSERRRPARRWP
jgi:hypothetical protein